MGDPLAPARHDEGQERHHRRCRTAPRAVRRFTFPRGLATRTLEGVPDALTLSRLRDERSADLTLRNLMDALNLTYELRARYRVFAYEAAQEGAEECATLFSALCSVEGDQVTALMRGLRERLAATEHGDQPDHTTARRPS
jgi:hypothetical protein